MIYDPENFSPGAVSSQKILTHGDFHPGELPRGSTPPPPRSLNWKKKTPHLILPMETQSNLV